MANKDRYIRQFRASDPERKAVEALARREAIKMSEASRLLLRAGAQALGVWQPEANQVQKGAMQ